MGGQATSVNTKAATERLDGIGLRPRVVTCDATGPLPGTYDRIVATVSVRPIPASWLRALRPGGRLVTTIAGTALILTADKTDDGGATGRIEWDRAGFMRTRTGPSYPLGPHPLLEEIRDAEGDHVRTGYYPVTNVVEAWELWSTLRDPAPRNRASLRQARRHPDSVHAALRRLMGQGHRTGR
ncbi:MAG: hypothetical protein ACRDRS_11345 [Pseudonocardiaceae bacterium]